MDFRAPASSLDPFPTPREFSHLPRPQQEKILAWGRKLAQRIIPYATQILIGPSLAKEPAGKVSHGTGVMINLSGRLVLATANHVIAEYEARRTGGEEVLFQVGNAILDPIDRAYLRKDPEDIALLDLTDGDLARIPREVYDVRRPWPCQLPEAEIWLALVGHPVQYRECPRPEIVNLTPMGGVMRVTSRGVGNLKCIFERDALVPVHGAYVPGPDTRFGGMSGGPAFYLEGDTLHLVGVVTDHSEMCDMFQVQRFDSLPERYLAM